MKPSPLSLFLRRAGMLAALATLGSSTALSATWYWDTDPATSGAQQASGTWKNGDSTWWNTAATVPWDNAASPGNIAHFGTSGGAGINIADEASRTITIDGTVNAAGLIFNTSSSGFGYILKDGNIVLADGSTIDVLGLNTNNNVERRHQILSSISGANINITRSSNTGPNLAMLQLRGSNTWSGTLSLSSSSSGLFVEAYNGTALNTLSSVSISANSLLVLASTDTFSTNFSITGTGPDNRGAIRFDASGTVSGAVTLTGDSAIGAVASGITGTVSGNIGESGGARVLSVNIGNNGGTITLSGTNTHTGGTILNAGTLNINSATALGTGNFTITGGTINNNSGAAITLANNNTQTWNGNFAFTGTNSLNLGTGAVSLGTTAGTARTVTVNGGTLNVGGVISNGTTATGLTKTGTGVLTFSGTAANAYTGPTTVSNGALNLAKTAGVNSVAGDLLIGGGRLQFTTNNQIADTSAVTVTAGRFNASDSTNLNTGLSGLNETIGSLAVSGSGTFNLNGSSNFVVNGAASFTGGTGTLFFMGSGGIFSAQSLTVADMSRTSSGDLAVSANTNVFVVYGNAGTQSAVRVGTGGLTLSGLTSLNHILLRGGNNGSKITLSGDVTTTGTFASAILRDSVGGTTGNTLVELSGTQTTPVSRTFNVGGGGADLTVGADVSLTNGVSSAASLIKTGAGTLTLNGTNTYTGTTTVNGGKLQLGGGINSSTQIAVNNATLELLASNVIGNTASLSLNNGTLITGAPTETLGTLAVAGTSQIDLVTAGNAVFFASSASLAPQWTGTLAILNWAAQAFGGTGNNQLFVGTNASGLDAATQVSKISFVNPTIDGVVHSGTYSAMILPTGEIVAIPETSSALLALLGSSFVLGRRRRK